MVLFLMTQDLLKYYSVLHQLSGEATEIYLLLLDGDKVRMSKVEETYALDLEARYNPHLVLNGIALCKVFLQKNHSQRIHPFISKKFTTKVPKEKWINIVVLYRLIIECKIYLNKLVSKSSPSSRSSQRAAPISPGNSWQVYTRSYVHVAIIIHQKALKKLRQDTWQSLLILTGLNSFQGFFRWRVFWKGKSCNRSHLTLKLRPQGLFFPLPWLQMLSLLQPTEDIISAYPWKNPLMLTLNIRITLPEFCIIT